MPEKQAFRVSIWISELIGDNFKDIFGRMEAVKELHNLLPLIEKYFEQIKEFIEENNK